MPRLYFNPRFREPMYDSRNPRSPTCRSTVALNWWILPFWVCRGTAVTLWEGTFGETPPDGNGFGIWNKGTPFVIVLKYVSVIANGPPPCCRANCPRNSLNIP